MQNDNDIYTPSHFKEIVRHLENLELILSGISDKDIVRRISKHDVFVRGELNDLNVIWCRFLRDRKELKELTIRDKYLESVKCLDSEEAQQIFHRKKELINSLKVDIKSLFLFSDIFFSKLVLLIRAVVGSKRNITYESFSSFLKSIRSLSNETLWEYQLYQNLGEYLERIDILLGFYRDKFIVHVNGPYQESISWSVFLPDIHLEHASWKLSEFDFIEFNKLLENLIDILPKKDKFGNLLLEKGDPRLKIETIFMNLHKIKDMNLKQKAEGYIRSVGLTSPDIYYLLKTIKETSTKIIITLEDHIKKEL